MKIGDRVDSPMGELELVGHDKEIRKVYRIVATGLEVNEDEVEVEKKVWDAQAADSTRSRKDEQIEADKPAVAAEREEKLEVEADNKAKTRGA